MKTVLLVCAMGAFLFSCGDDEKDKISACDCRKEANKLAEEMKHAAFSGDESKRKEKETKLDDLVEDCKDYSKVDYKNCE